MTIDALNALEAHRLELQAELDRAKTKNERNQLGQFATPSLLASALLEQAKRLLPADAPIRFLDPALGTGAFLSALLRVFPADRIAAAQGYEIDPHYGEPARLLWRDRCANIVIDDFTRAAPPEQEIDKFNLLICNPPYVRHHHLPADDKKRLQAQSSRAFHAKVSGLAGLYVHFIGIADAWLQQGGVAGWLIPSEFMDVKYGNALRHYLTSQVRLLNVHRFDSADVQFGDALVSSVVVWFQQLPPEPDNPVTFSLGKLDKPRMVRQVMVKTLQSESKWTRFPQYAAQSTSENEARVRDLFDIKRGIATGANEFFIVDANTARAHELPAAFLTQILPSPRYLPDDEISADSDGKPLLKSPLFLVDCTLPEAHVARDYPTLWRYFQIGIERGVQDRYLCQHRTPWYSQDKRAPAPFLCTYMGRPSNGHANNPFRFILNHSCAVAPNVYLNLYPKAPLAHVIAERPALKHEIWRALQAMPIARLIGEGRVYGGELYKLEPKELGNLPVSAIFQDIDSILTVTLYQKQLF